MPSNRSASLILKVQTRLLNPLIRLLVRLGLSRSVALLETTGRISGEPRQTPVGNGLDKQTNAFWLVTERGHDAQYVHNIKANPKVRVKIGRHWHDGVAHLLEGDDPRERQRSMPAMNAAIVRALCAEMLSIRIDLAS